MEKKARKEHSEDAAQTLSGKICPEQHLSRLWHGYQHQSFPQKSEEGWLEMLQSLLTTLPPMEQNSANCLKWLNQTSAFPLYYQNYCKTYWDRETGDLLGLLNLGQCHWLQHWNMNINNISFHIWGSQTGVLSLCPLFHFCPSFWDWVFQSLKTTEKGHQALSDII